MKPAKIIKLFLIATGYLLLTKPLVAQTAVNGLSAIPPTIENVEVTPGKTYTQSIKVRNESTETKTINVSVHDFIVTNNEGRVEFMDNVLDAINNRWAASSWIQLSTTSLTLEPGQTKNLNFTVMPPENALSGGHYAAIVYSPDSAYIGNNTGASIQTKVGTLVYITIPGDISQNAIIQSFSAPKFSEFGPIDFNATIKNSSDIHIQPVGSITIKNWFGGKTAQLNLDPTNIFPYTTRDFQSTLNKKWLFGRYQATLNAVYGTAGGLISATIFFWVIPWRLIILIIAAIAIIITLVTVLKKKPKNGSKSSDDQVTELEQELEQLKKKYKDN